MNPIAEKSVAQSVVFEEISENEVVSV